MAVITFTNMQDSQKRTINLQTRVSTELKDQAEKSARDAGFDDLQAAIRYFVRMLAKGQLKPTLIPSSVANYNAYVSELDMVSVEIEDKIARGEWSSLNVANDVDDLFSQLNANENSI